MPKIVSMVIVFCNLLVKILFWVLCDSVGFVSSILQKRQMIRGKGGDSEINTTNIRKTKQYRTIQNLWYELVVKYCLSLVYDNSSKQSGQFFDVSKSRLMHEVRKRCSFIWHCFGSLRMILNRIFKSCFIVTSIFHS